MKIAVVNNYYYLRGGSERVLFEDQAGLESAGHQVLPFTARSDLNLPSPSQGLFPPSYDYSTVSGADRIRAAAESIYSPRAGAAFAAFLDTEKPNVIHCHNIYGRLTTAVLDAAKQRRIPVVLSAHDYKLICPSYLMLRRNSPCDQCVDGGYWRCAANRCHKGSFSSSLVYTVESYFNRLFHKYGSVARVLCPSRFLLRLLARGGYAASQLVFHANAVDAGAFQPSYAPGDYALYAGRLAPGKGLSTLLAAFENSGIPLKLAGDGPLRNELAVRNASDVEFFGHQSADTLHRLIREAAFVVVPSEWYENAPMAVLEAFAHGKPVLASNIGGIPELVQDGQTGVLFPPGDVPALANAACKLWSNKPLLEQMGRNARETVLTRYSQRNRIQHLLQIYREVGA